MNDRNLKVALVMAMAVGSGGRGGEAGSSALLQDVALSSAGARQARDGIAASVEQPARKEIER